MKRSGLPHNLDLWAQRQRSLFHRHGGPPHSFAVLAKPPDKWSPLCAATRPASTLSSVRHWCVCPRHRHIRSEVGSLYPEAGQRKSLEPTQGYPPLSAGPVCHVGPICLWGREEFSWHTPSLMLNSRHPQGHGEGESILNDIR